MMGNINKFRPLNGSGRSGRNGPSFLVCALFIGLCIVTVSYYNLSNQYTKLYDSMTDMIKQQKLLEAHLEHKKNEKLKEQKSQESLQETKTLLGVKLKALTEANNLNIKAREEITKKTQELNESQTKNKELESRIKELETLKSELNEEIVKKNEQINELKNKLFPNKNQNDISLQVNKSSLDPKRKIIDNQPINENKDIERERSKEIKQINSLEENKKLASSKIENKRLDPVVNLLNKDKNTN